MISKKQRKSSRIYNTKLRKSDTNLNRLNTASTWKQRSFRMRREANERAHFAKTAPALAIPPISYMRRRESQIPRQTFLSFIPNSARAILSVFKKAS